MFIGVGSVWTICGSIFIGIGSTGVTSGTTFTWADSSGVTFEARFTVDTSTGFILTCGSLIGIWLLLTGWKLVKVSPTFKSFFIAVSSKFWLTFDTSTLFSSFLILFFFLSDEIKMIIANIINKHPTQTNIPGKVKNQLKSKLLNIYIHLPTILV